MFLRRPPAEGALVLNHLRVRFTGFAAREGIANPKPALDPVSYLWSETKGLPAEAALFVFRRVQKVPSHNPVMQVRLAAGARSSSSNRRRTGMKDMQAHLEKLRTQAAECEILRDSATDKTKQELFAKMAQHFKVLAAEVERAMNATSP